MIFLGLLWFSDYLEERLFKISFIAIVRICVRERRVFGGWLL